MVVPNPYVAHSGYNETEYLRKIRFNNLTPKCTIKIYTISGELVNTIEHDNVDEGYTAWDLRSMNNQEVAPGLYLFTVQSDGVKDFIGKFAVIR
jgi:flagellar hook assembly protein FlgD